MPEANEPLPTVYPLEAPSTPIELFRGEIKMGDHEPVNGRVWLDTQHGPSVLWALDEPIGALDLGSTTLRFSLPNVGIIVADGLTLSAGSETSGTLAFAGTGNEPALVSMTIHWMNLPAILPAGLLQSADGRSQILWAGRWEVSAGGWLLTLDSRPDHAQVWEQLRETRSCGITHVGSVRRTNGETFSQSEAHDALSGFQLALSFALGRWCAPALPVGFDSRGQRVWEQWAPWHCDPVDGHMRWWSSTASDDLGHFVELFMDAWRDEARRPVVNLLAHRAIASNDGNVVEARLMVAQAGIEYLSWVTHVLSGLRSKTQHGKAPIDSVAEHHLRELLISAHIPLSIPAYLPKLASLAPSDSDGPRAVVWVRNKLTHPKDAAEPYRIEGAVAEAWLLLVDYLQLLALHWLGYEGRYGWRKPGRWEGDVSEVPWSASR